jgi:transposase-like protein
MSGTRIKIFEQTLNTLMANQIEPCRYYDESFKQAAVEFLDAHGNSLEATAAELGVLPAELRAWKNKTDVSVRSGNSLTGIAQLRAENESLRSQVTHLQGQWEMLKTTLGVLSTTVCTREMM